MAQEKYLREFYKIAIDAYDIKRGCYLDGIDTIYYYNFHDNHIEKHVIKGLLGKDYGQRNANIKEMLIIKRAIENYEKGLDKQK